MGFQVPILLITWIRPESTKLVLGSIRALSPRCLFIASDGPRPGNQKDAALISETRKMISEAIDWNCDVMTLYRSKNEGCRFGPSSAISWFFSHVDAGIILEDDCLPHQDFFPFCEDMLDRFRHAPSIWHISGNNFCAPKICYAGHPWSLTSLAQVWGWATWHDRWRVCEKNYFSGPTRHLQSAQISNWCVSSEARRAKLKDLKKLDDGFDTWDFQWQVQILNAGGLCVSPSSNLISNIGNTPDASHTREDPRAGLRVTSLPSDWRHYTPSFLRISRRLTRFYELNMGLRIPLRRRLRNLVQYLLWMLRSVLKNQLNPNHFFSSR